MYRAGSIILAALAAFAATADAATQITWRTLAPGIEYASPKVTDNSVSGSGILHVVRLDASRAKLRALMASALDRKKRTAQAWCSEFGLIAVINAGMYDKDYMTHVGYMKSGDQVNNKGWSRTYNSILAFDPVSEGVPPARILDGNAPSPDTARYRTVIQNLRLIRGNGVNVWQKQFREWSEAALAEDDKGRILFLFSRTPFTMFEFNQKILSLSLGIVRAMHLEGGPEASLSICSPELQLHLAGSYEPEQDDHSASPRQLLLPNVIGVSGR